MPEDLEKQFYALPEASLGYDYEKQSPLNLIKPYLKYIIIAIVLLVLAYFALDFFVFSVKEIRIEVQDLEGNQISNAVIKVLNEKGETITSISGKPFIFSLRKGDYKLIVKAFDFKTVMQSITVRENETITVELEKNLEVSILEVKIPEKLYSLQKATGIITVQNNSNEDAIVELVVPEKSEAFLSIREGSLLFKPGETKQFTLAIEVKDILRIPVTGLDVNAFVRIKYTKEKKYFGFKILRKPNIVVPKSLSFSDIALSKETFFEKSILIENKSSVMIESLQLSLEVIEATKNDLLNARNWLAFSENNQKNLEISLLEKEKKEVKIKLSIPITAKKETVKAVLLVNADFLDKEIRMPIDIEITEEAVALLLIELKPKDEAFINFDANKHLYEKNTEYYLLITNAGTISFTNINVLLSNFDECNEDYFSFDASKTIQLLNKGEEQKIPFTLSMPSSTEDQQEMDCNLLVLYRDPLTKKNARQSKVMKLIAVKESIVR